MSWESTHVLYDVPVSLPESIRIRISSEAAGTIALTPVVHQQMPTVDLVRMMLAVTRKDAERVRELLRRGSFVSGASRFRWEPLEVPADELQSMFVRFPDAEPDRPFAWKHCHTVRFASVTISKDAAGGCRWWRRQSYWDVLQSLKMQPKYIDYSYREQADVYGAKLDAEAQSVLRDKAGLLPFSTLARAIRAASLDHMELVTHR